MQVKKLTLISIMAVAICFAGCSDWDAAKNPVASKDELAKGIPTLQPLEDIQVSDNSGVKSIPLPIITLVGSIHQKSEDGCIYLLPNQGEFPHELQFLDEFKGPIKENYAIEVTGRFNPDIYGECVGGAVFQVYKFKYLAFEDVPRDYEKTQAGLRTLNTFIPGPIVDHPADREITITGTFRLNDNGCEYLELVGGEDNGAIKKLISLTFQDKGKTEIKNGAKIKVTGNYSQHDISYCALGLNFYVKNFKVAPDLPLGPLQNFAQGK